MTYLLDTHAFVWHALDDDNLPSHVRDVLNDPESDVAVSIASLWEFGIKTSIGKWPVAINVLGLQALAEEQAIEIVPITPGAIHATAAMAWFNKDPFDRIIVATALTRGDILVSIEEPFERWGVKRYW